MRISDWSSDVCSSDLSLQTSQAIKQDSDQIVDSIVAEDIGKLPDVTATESLARIAGVQVDYANGTAAGTRVRGLRSEEHTSELQSLMRISYAVFCLKKKKYTNTTLQAIQTTE